MNTNLNIIVNLQPTNPLERKLNRMREIKDAVKALDAEFDMLKKEAIAEYFIVNEEYRTDKGLLLASYKAIESLRFNTDRFKTDHADIYDMYKEKGLSYRFDLK